jgi:hypothetical protein
MTEIGSNVADSRKKEKLSNLLVLSIFLPFLFLALVHVVFLIRLVGVRNDTTYPEAASLYSFLTTLHTGNLYADPFQLPLNIQTYGPAFYFVGAILAKIAHGDPMMTAELARMVSLFSFFASVALLGFLCFRLEGRRMQTAIVVILGLACAWAVPACASARADALSIFLILGALTVYCEARGRSRLIFWAGILGTLSCLTKQSTAPVLVALFIDTLIAMRFRNTIALILGSVPVPAMVLSALWLRHEQFNANFFALGHAVYSWPGAFHTTIDLLRTNQVAIVPILIALVGIGLSWRKEKYRAILLASAIAFLSSVAALANIGGAGNYMMLPWLLVILFVPPSLVLFEQWTRRTAVVPLGLLLVGVLLVIHQRNLLPAKLPIDLDTDGVSKFNMLSNSSYIEMHSREPQLLDANFYNQLALGKAFSFAPILGKIDREHYDLILIGGEDGEATSDFVVEHYRGSSYWGADTVEEMRRHYRPLCEVPDYLALVPRDRSDVPEEGDIARIFRQPCHRTERMPQLAAGVR